MGKLNDIQDLIMYGRWFIHGHNEVTKAVLALLRSFQRDGNLSDQLSGEIEQLAALQNEFQGDVDVFMEDSDVILPSYRMRTMDRGVYRQNKSRRKGK